MSSFVVSDKHISAIVTFAASRPGVYFSDASSWKPVGRDTLCQERLFSILKFANETAVAEDRGDIEPIAFDFKVDRVVISPVQALKAIQCLEYQCSDAAWWHGCDAQRSLESISRAAVEALPGYDDAKWAIA